MVVWVSDVVVERSTKRDHFARKLAAVAAVALAELLLEPLVLVSVAYVVYLKIQSSNNNAVQYNLLGVSNTTFMSTYLD